MQFHKCCLQKKHNKIIEENVVDRKIYSENYITLHYMNYISSM